MGVIPTLLVTSAMAQGKAKAQKPLMRDFIGLNVHTVQVDPKLYTPVVRLLRDYHPYMWDVDDKPGTPRPFRWRSTLTGKTTVENSAVGTGRLTGRSFTANG
ncbi:MAG: hypothetical protein A2X48_24010 [Lentisphaerae bacterium GWF2_49_21]|nr:MAG: hypothetical protein A2X48_24010 [Lentisphaerae bacterium GWF2_49_21]